MGNIGVSIIQQVQKEQEERRRASTEPLSLRDAAKRFYCEYC